LVAVGEGNALVTSTNGSDWEVFAPTEYGPTTVAFGNGVFVVARGTIPPKVRVSSDAIHWTERELKASLEWPYVTFQQGRFVMVGWGGEFLTSSNGLDWEIAFLPIQSQFMTGAAAHDDISVVVGFTGIVFTSTNGSDWLEVNQFTTKNLHAVAWTSHGFVAAGDTGLIFVSSNGVDWVNRSVPLNSHLYAVAEANGLTLAAGFGVAGWSNGTFVVIAGDTNNFLINGLTFAWDHYWSVGEGGTLAKSTDGRTWSQVNSRITGFNSGSYYGEITAAAFGNDLFVCVGGGYSLVSPDGVSWTNAGFAPPYLYQRDLVFGAGRFVAVGVPLNVDSRAIAISTNGIDWIGHQAPWSRPDFARVTFTGGKFIAAGPGGQLAVSTNGLDWSYSQGHPWEYPVTGTACGNGKYLLGSYDGALFTSQDGLTWTSNYLAEARSLYDLVFAHGKFVGVGLDTNSQQKLFISEDGMNWRSRESPGLRLALHNGIFVAPAFLRLWSSTDGENFIEHHTGFAHTVNAMTFGRDTFILGGGFRTIVQSAPVSFTPTLSYAGRDLSGAHVVRLAAPAGYSYKLEATENFIDWTRVGTFQPTNGVFEAKDGAAGAMRFYRAR
jgi:hypothetical protein